MMQLAATLPAEQMDAETFKAHRKRLNATQTELAAALGVHRVTVTRWETGFSAVPIVYARLIQRMKSADVARFARLAKQEGQHGR
jgi:DNA-binding transcriptional regulator YiaG